MTLDPAANRYVKYIRNIRTIQVSQLPIPLLLYAMLFCQVQFLDTNPSLPPSSPPPPPPSPLPYCLRYCMYIAPPFQSDLISPLPLCIPLAHLSSSSSPLLLFSSSPLLFYSSSLLFPRLPAGLQDYLCRRADKHMIPKVDNTNVDRSVATIHATVLACLRHTSQVINPLFQAHVG